MPDLLVGFRTSLRFLLDQQFEPPVLLLIATLFGTGHVSLRTGTNEVYRLTFDSFKSLPIIISYFTRFPLKSHKKESYERWCEISLLMLNKEHLEQPGLDRIRA